LPVGSFSGKLKFVTTDGRAYEFPLYFEVIGTPSVQLNNISPANGSTVPVSSSSIEFTWQDNLDALYYNIEIASDAAFTNIVHSEIVNASPFQFTNTLIEGQYFWRIRMVGNCGTGPWSDATAFNVVFVGVEEWSASQNMSVIPNPAHDMVTISRMPSKEYVVTDMLGRTVAKGNGNKQITLDCSAWPAGVYVVVSGSERCQLVVQ
jgi:hypothetical protein